MKPFGNGRAEKGVSLVDFPDGVADIVCRGLFDEVALCAGLDGLHDIRLVAVRREHEHPGFGDGLEQLAGGLQSVEQRHGHVHQNQIGAELLAHGDRLRAVLGLADHFQVVFELQNLLYSLRKARLSSASRTVIRFMNCIISRTFLFNECDIRMSAVKLPWGVQPMQKSLQKSCSGAL